MMLVIIGINFINCNRFLSTHGKNLIFNVFSPTEVYLIFRSQEEILYSIFISLSLVVTEHESPLGNIKMLSGHLYNVWPGNLNHEAHPFLSPLCPATVKSNQSISLYSFVWGKCFKILNTQATPHPVSLLLIHGGLGISSGDSLFISTARSHYGLSVISLLLKLISLASLSLRLERKFQIAQNKF